MVFSKNIAFGKADRNMVLTARLFLRVSPGLRLSVTYTTDTDGTAMDNVNITTSPARTAIMIPASKNLLPDFSDN